MELGDRWMETEGRLEARACIQQHTRGCVGVAPRGQGRAPGVTPLARPCHRCRRSVGGRLRRWRGEDDTVDGVADVWGSCGSGCERGRQGAWAWAMRWAASWAGLLRAGGAACWAAACLADREAEQARAARPSPLFFSFLFSFSTPLI